MNKVLSSPVSGEPADSKAREPAAASVTTLVAVATCAGVVLLHHAGLKEGFRAPKVWVLAIGCSLVISAAFVEAKNWRAAWTRARPSLLAFGPLAFALVAATAAAGWERTALETTLMVSTVLVSLGVVAAMPIRFSWMFLALRVLGVIVAIWLLWDWIEMIGSQSTLRARFSLRASLGNPADSAIFLLVPCLLYQHRVIRLLAERRRSGVGLPRSSFALLTTLAATLIVHAAVLLTQTLSAVVALLAASCVMTLRSSMRRFWWVAAGGLVVTLTVLWLSPVRDRVADKLHDLRQGDFNALLTGRLDGWTVAMELARREPLLGHGPGSYGRHYNTVKEELTIAGTSFYRGHGAQSSFGNAHNELLEVTAETGLVGLVFTVWAAVYLSLRASRLPRGSRRLAWSTLVSYAIVSQAYFPFHAAATALPALVIIAWILSHPRAGPRMQQQRPVFVIRAVVAMAVLGALLWMYIPLVRASARVERALWLAESRAAGIGSLENATHRRAWQDALNALMQASSVRPDEARVPLAIGSYYLIAEDPENALRWYERSLELELRPEALLNRARALREVGREQEASLEEERVLRLDPFRRRTLRPR